MSAPTIRIDYEANPKGHLSIEWPDPKPDTFEMTPECLESLVAECNAGRELAVSIEAADELGVLVDDGVDWWGRITNTVTAVALVVIAVVVLV